eukprot:272729_1
MGSTPTLWKTTLLLLIVMAAVTATHHSHYHRHMRAQFDAIPEEEGGSDLQTSDASGDESYLDESDESWDYDTDTYDTDSDIDSEYDTTFEDYATEAADKRRHRPEDYDAYMTSANVVKLSQAD